MKKIVLLMLVILFVFSLRGESDLIFEYESILTASMDGETEKHVSHEKNYLSDIGWKIEDLGNQTITIIRADKKVIWNIDLRNNLYYELSFLEADQLKTDTEADMASSGKQSDIRVENTGIEENVLGYDSTKYLVYMDNELMSEVWTTTDEPFDQNFMQLYKNLNSFSVSGFEELEQIEGFPVQITNYFDTEEAEIRSKSYLKTVTDQKIREEEFELPEGLIKINAPMGRE
jgi:hypothetical protein